MDHPYGPLSLLPPLAAIVLAVVTRRPVVSLLVGIFCGALITTGGNPLLALADTCEVHLWPTLIDPGKMRVFSFTLLMAAMIGVISRCGGMNGLIALISPWAKSRRSGQLTTWLLGMLIFFDDYANTILLGGTLRPLCDRLRISREKLAYLVDSTAAPVASLALLSTWIAVEVDYIDEGIKGIDSVTSLKPMELFIASIPYRFYAWMALLMVPLIALLGRDFGPMLKAERKALTTPPDGPKLSKEEETSTPTSHWLNAVAPIALTLVVVMYLLYLTGKSSLGDESPRLRDILGAADSSLALQYGSLAGLALAAILSWGQRLLDGAQIGRAAASGMRVVLPAIAILWTASALSRMTGNRSVENTASESFEFEDHRLYTGDYLAGLIMPSADAEAGDNGLIIKLLPTAIFVLAAILSFSTGTSFGTMGLLMPMTVTLVYGILRSQPGVVEATDPILMASVASVLAGAVMGDHCSPISDTTILSSQACQCDHIAHVVTQAPYSVVAGVIAVGLGTVPVGWGVSLWILFPLQVAALIATVRFFGRRVEQEPADAQPVA